MPLLIPTFFGDVVLHFTGPGDGGERIVTFGVGLTDPASPGEALTEVVSIVNGMYSSAASDDYAFLLAEMVIGSDAPPYNVIQLAGGGAGGLTLDDPPPGQCICVNKQTFTPGRQGHGRFFWPGSLDTGGIDESGLIEGGPLAALQSLFDTMLIDLEDADHITGMYVLHLAGSPVEDPSLVSALHVRQKVSWLRSREY